MSRRTLPALVAETPLQPQPPALIMFGRDESGKPRAAWFGASDVAAATAAASVMKMRALPLTSDAHRALAAELAAGRVFASGRAFTSCVRKDLYARLVEIAGSSAGLSVAVALCGSSGPSEASEDAKSEVALSSKPETPAAVSPTLDPEGSGDEPPVKHDGPSIAANVLKPKDTPAAASTPRPGAHIFVGEPLPSERDQIGLGSIVLAHDSPEDGWWEAEVIGCNGRVFSLRWRDFPTQPTILRKASELALLPPGEA